MSETVGQLRLYNTLTREKEPFAPIDPNNVRMYVCGPTVYDYAHIGNARPVIVFDVLYRLLRHVYGEGHVTYVRNITDVDDKINARAARDHPDLPLNEAIRKVTEATNAQFQADVKALGCLEPDSQPRATEHIDGMRAMIDRLVAQGVAYVAEGHVLFSPSVMNARKGPRYGALSRRPFDEMLAGARVDVASYKRDEMDFVLWKPSKPGEPGWPSPAGIDGLGRPGWHIECSAMSMAKLLEPFGGGLSCDDPMKNVFDIHGGGIDLVFPHHENEIAQSCCAFGTERMANVWMHNGFLQVEGRKMAKSEGNFVTIHDLLHTEVFGGRKWPGEVLRLAMLMTHYREPIDFSVSRLLHAENVLKKLKSFAEQRINRKTDQKTWVSFLGQLRSDLNTPMAVTVLEQACEDYGVDKQYTVFRALDLLGFKTGRTKVGLISDRFRTAVRGLSGLSRNEFVALIQSAQRAPVFPSGRIKPEAEIMDSIAKLSALRDEFASDFHAWEQQSAELRHRRFEFGDSQEDRKIGLMVDQRLRHIRKKNWMEADRIRDELLEQGIQLKDGKDPATGERVTTWEVKR